MNGSVPLPDWSGFLPTGLIALLTGLLAGLALAQSGAASSRRLLAVFYGRDFTVFKVLGTALLTVMTVYPYAIAAGWAPALPLIHAAWWRAPAAGALLGLGLAIGGWCPVTAAAGLGRGRVDAAVFLAGLLAGVFGLGLLWPVLGAEVGRPAGFTPASIRPGLALILAVLLPGLFVGATRRESRLAGSSAPAGAAVWRAGAALALLLAAGAFLLPGPPAAAGRPARAETALRLVAEGADRIAPLDLAARLMAGEPGLLVADLRPAAEFEAFRIRGSLRVTPDEAAALGRLPVSGQVVLASDADVPAAQVWMALRQLGRTNVALLAGGVSAFWRDCLTPPSLREAADEAEARSAFAQYEARRRWFLGPSDGWSGP